MKQPINKIKYYPFGPRINAIRKFFEEENSIVSQHSKKKISPQQFLSAIEGAKQSKYGHKKKLN